MRSLVLVLLLGSVALARPPLRVHETRSDLAPYEEAIRTGKPLVIWCGKAWCPG